MIFDTKTHTTTEEFFRQAAEGLSRTDAVMAGLIERIGPCQLGMPKRNHYFASLVEAIVYQQLAGKAAAAILSRFRVLYSPRRFPTALEIQATTDEQLRSAGVSPQKISYIRDLCSRIIDGSLRLQGISSMGDEEVVRQLTQVKGIGRWTSEMFLIFCLGRPDVLPLNDLGILNAVRRAYGFRQIPAARTLERLGRKWQPYRSVACWYLWASVDGNGIAKNAAK